MEATRIDRSNGHRVADDDRDHSATAYTNTGTGVLAALSDLDQETNRSALNIEPVATQGNEVFEILKKRLFEKLPENAAIDAVATLTDLLINVIASDTEETIYSTTPCLLVSTGQHPRS